MKHAGLSFSQHFEFLSLSLVFTVLEVHIIMMLLTMEAAGIWSVAMTYVGRGHGTCTNCYGTI